MSGSGYDIEGLYDNDSTSVGGKTGGGGITREVKHTKVFGKARGTHPKLFPYRREEAYLPGKMQVWHVSKADRMEAEEAGAMLGKILQMFGLERENAPDQAAFVDAMLFCHTINSGSTLQPGRSRIYIGKGGEGFDFQRVVQVLGVDLRRFFRAYADEVRRVNDAVIADAYKIDDPDAQLRYEWLMQVAADRDLTRYPNLAHDSSDACSGLTPNERSALALSKKSIFGEIANVADSMSSNSRTRAGHNPYQQNSALGGVRE